ncbi:MAG: BON domain-containing protein [Gammaproteobacteria bacterium]|nr:BON domain-containing protein [Gammaproteobacteria bacterium]
MKQQNSMMIVTALLAIALAGCERSPAPETAGEKLDKAIENTGEKIEQGVTTLKEKTEQAGTAIDDTAITAKIKAAIIGDPSLKVLQINVDTVNGMVTLTGTVDSVQSSDRAKELAGAVEGVKSVDNRLTVKSAG